MELHELSSRIYSDSWSAINNAFAWSSYSIDSLSSRVSYDTLNEKAIVNITVDATVCYREFSSDSARNAFIEAYKDFIDELTDDIEDYDVYKVNYRFNVSTYKK